jgi:dual specificity MAP kinase phosphatase
VGGEGLKKDHEVVQFLVKENKCSSLKVYRDGIDAIQKAYPFLVGQSLNAHRGLAFPTPIESGLYLGNWANASDTEKLDNLKIRRVVTIHNEPKNLKLPSTSLPFMVCLTQTARMLSSLRTGSAQNPVATQPWGSS